MPGTGTRDHDLRVPRVITKDEVRVRGGCVHAHNGGLQRTSGSRHETLKQAMHCCNILLLHFAAQTIRLRCFAFMMNGCLHSVTQIRKTVEEPGWSVLPN